VWGTRIDIALSNPPDTQVDTLGSRAAAFYDSLGTNFDRVCRVQRPRLGLLPIRVGGQRQIVVGRRGLRSSRPVSRPLLSCRRQTDRPLADSARQHTYAGTEQQHGPLSGRSSGMAAQRPRAQSPYGLSRCRRRRLSVWRWRAGGVSCACDGQGDGVTNPAPINGNTLASELAAPGTAPTQVVRGSTPTLVTPYPADDDGGFFRWRAWQYDQDSPMSISPGTGQAPSAPTRVRVVP
jgi:hypothetical protein